MTNAMNRLYFSAPVWLQNLLVSAYGYHLYRKRYTGIYSDIVKEIRNSKAWKPEDIAKYQGEKLHEMVKYCREKIPYYQRVFSEYSVHENDITSLEDITKLPVLSKQILREQGSLFRAPDARPYIIQHTSGSTGTPLSLWVDEYTYKLAMALLVDHEENHGIKFGARRATFAGRLLQPVNDLKPPFSRYNRSENQQLFSSYHLSQSTFSDYEKELNAFRPQEIIGYPSAICELATLYQQKARKPKFQLKAVITNSETLLAWQRDRIESVFDCPVLDYYGTSEYVLFAGQGKDGLYHLNPLLGITEVICQSPGDTNGVLVATSLTNTVMPLLRYEIGDVAEKISITNGTVVNQLKTIVGRVDDYIETPDGRRIGRIDHIFKGVEGIKEAQVIQDKKEHCLIKVVLSDASRFDKELLLSSFYERTGKDLSATIEYVPEIPKGKNGKFKSVVCLK